MPMQDSYTLDAFLSANQQYQASKGMTNDNTSKTSVMDICQNHARPLWASVVEMPT